MTRRSRRHYLRYFMAFDDQRPKPKPEDAPVRVTMECLNERDADDCEKWLKRLGATRVDRWVGKASPS